MSHHHTLLRYDFEVSTNLNRRDFLRTAGGAFATASLGAAPSKKPNFVIFLVDDMGFSDARCYGGDIDTPHLDKLAEKGLRFTQCYSTARCGPSRSCLLTGNYAQQTASDVMTPGNVPDFTKFIPEYLKPLGYRSYHSGKWHMRFAVGEGGAGFDHTYTMLDELRFFTQKRHELDGKLLPKPEEGYYSTTAIADYSVKFLKEHAKDHEKNPFFLYVAFHGPHFPLHAPAADIEHYNGKFTEGWDTARERKGQRMQKMGLVNHPIAPLEPQTWPPWNTPEKELIEKAGPGEVAHAVPWSTLNDEQKGFQRMKMAIHAAMITRTDTEIGKIVKQVDAMGAARDTVFLFLSDNGASAEQLIRGDGHDRNAPPGSAATHLGLGPGWSSNSNAPFRLHKSWVNEGGISSPLIVNWPNGIKDQNKLRHEPCHFVDILPTLVDLAGGPVPKLSGRSIAPAFNKDGTAAHEFIYFHHNNNRAIRMGDWKVVSTGKGGPWELYNIKKDRGEQYNLAASQPDRVKKMAALWQQKEDEFARVREAAPPSNKLRMNTGAV